MATDRLVHGAHVLVDPGSESNGRGWAIRYRKSRKSETIILLIFNLSDWRGGAWRARGSVYLCYFILEIRMNNIYPFRLHDQVWEFLFFFAKERVWLFGRFPFWFGATNVWGTKWLKQIPLANSHSKRSMFFNKYQSEARPPLIPAPTNRFFYRRASQRNAFIHRLHCCRCVCRTERNSQ